MSTALEESSRGQALTGVARESGNLLLGVGNLCGKPRFALTSDDLRGESVPCEDLESDLLASPWQKSAGKDRKMSAGDRGREYCCTVIDIRKRGCPGMVMQQARAMTSGMECVPQRKRSAHMERSPRHTLK